VQENGAAAGGITYNSSQLSRSFGAYYRGNKKVRLERRKMRYTKIVSLKNSFPVSKFSHVWSK
jgi:hypothetical protein